MSKNVVDIVTIDKIVAHHSEVGIMELTKADIPVGLP